MSKANGSTSSAGPSNKPADTLEETAANITTPPPTNISIGSLYVYNFSRSSDQPATIKLPIHPKSLAQFHSPATSSGTFCRICHEGDSVEDLISPCHCTGTVGLVHQSCMERWLSLAGSDKCEICNYMFITVRSPRSFIEWIHNSRSDSESRRGLVSDFLCFLLLTPLAGVSSFLCVEGAKKQVLEGNSLEAGCLMALATFLITIYLIWNALTCRFHIKNFLKWRTANQRVKVVRVRRLSSSDVLPSSAAEVVLRIGESQFPTQNQQPTTSQQQQQPADHTAVQLDEVDPASVDL